MSLGTVSYNNVVIDFPKVTVNARPMYDSADRVEGSYILTFNISGVVCRSSDSVSIPAEVVNLKKALETPRQRFLWEARDVGVSTDRIVYDIIGEGTPGSDQILDRNWGPKPRGVMVEQMPGAGSARVRLVIEAVVAVCAMPRDIEELWWEITSSYDKDFSCTRTITGQIRTKGQVDYNTASDIFQNYTGLFPSVPKNFQREGFQHTLNKAGNVINFTCVDKQVWRTLPRPMTDGAATFRMDFQGAKIVKTLSGYFKAPHDVPKNVIAEFVTRLIHERFPGAVAWGEADPGAASGDHGSDFFLNFSFINHEFENRIDFSVTAMTVIQVITGGDAPAASIRNLDQVLKQGMLGDIANVSPESGFENWDSSDGTSESGKNALTAINASYDDRGMLGTSKLIPQVVDPFYVCDVADLPATATVVGIDQPFGQEDGPTQNPSTPEPLPSFDVVSEVHRIYPYTSYVEVYQVITEYHNRILPVPVILEKTGVASPKDVIQQMARPTVSVIRAGTARRLGRMPDIPEIRYWPFHGQTGDGDERSNMVRRDIRTHQPKLMNDGQTLEFQQSWNIHFILPDNDPKSTFWIMPTNPQLNSASPVIEAQLQDGTLYQTRLDVENYHDSPTIGGSGEVTLEGNEQANYLGTSTSTPSP